MPAAGEVIQFTFQQVSAGQLCENVWHLREIAPLTTDAQRGAAADAMLAVQAAVQTGAVTYPSVIIKQMTPVAFDEQIWVPSTTPNGTATGNAENNTVAAILTKRTGIAGKSHRGRVYYPGVPQAFQNVGGNTMNSTGALAYAALAAAIMGLFGESGTDPHFKVGVYSRVIGGARPFTVAGWQELSRLDVQPIFGNQRRRRLGVGA
jgi:hypothetical protein